MLEILQGDAGDIGILGYVNLIVPIDEKVMGEALAVDCRCNQEEDNYGDEVTPEPGFEGGGQAE